MLNHSTLTPQGSPRGYHVWPSVSDIRPASANCRVVHAGEYLYHAGDRRHDAYLIRSGNFKCYTVYANGEEQIIGLHGAGDVVGFDAFFGIQAQCSVVAMDTGHVQALPLTGKSMAENDGPGSTQLVVQAMYKELLRFTCLLHMERHPTDRRLAEFLLDFSERQRQRGMSPDRLMLPVSRRDLAAYLGLAPETLSRTFSSFQATGLVELTNREVTIADRAGLEALAGVS